MVFVVSTRGWGASISLDAAHSRWRQVDVSDQQGDGLQLRRQNG
jgi:hypothetical protein